MSFKKYLLTLFLFLGFITFSQENEFSLSVKVVDESNSKLIKNADVSVNGRVFLFSVIKEEYLVKAKKGDELIIEHPDFDTVYHTITSNEEIKILVKGFVPQSRKDSYFISRKVKVDTYHQNLDSAKFYKQIDIDKSLTFLKNSLEDSNSKERNAAAYKTLADIYLFWKQYDLAVNNYKLSIQIKENTTAKIVLAKAQFLLEDYKNSQQNYEEVLKDKLSIFDEITVLEGLGNVFSKTKNYIEAIGSYNKGLAIAKSNKVTSKITDLNSKIAQVYAAQGEISKAKIQFNNSLDLASKENINRSLIEEDKVADFYNDSRQFDDEIKLRKKSLQKTKSENKLIKEKPKTADSITTQKINYKIGTAYILKEDYKSAIPYLEKSKADAKKKKDIVVEKDATRKISEVFANLGEEELALKNYKEYVALVDSLYIRKEQEIQQIKRFSKKILESQSRIASLEKDKELVESKISLAFVDQKLSEESNQKQRLIIYSLVGGFLLMSLLLYFMYRTNKQQKLANNLLALKSMRSQMNPHFIFNALNSVNSFIAVNDERNANRYLSEFSVLMRSVLENSDEDFIPLTKEVELLELYVKLEHNRFKDKFDYQIKVDDNINLEQFSIPPMLLQPYIENAIWHGLRYRKEKGNLTISINQKDQETISISIIDDGIGRKQSQELKTKNQLKQKSKGMSTIKNRITILNDMYKDRISVAISNVLETGEGTKVELLLKRK